MSDKPTDRINFNGRSNEVYERIKGLEVRMENQRADTKDIKDDLKDIKKAMGPLINEVYFQEKLVKIGGSLISIVLAGLVTWQALGG